MLIYFAYERLVLDTTGVALKADRCDEYGNPLDLEESGPEDFRMLIATLPGGDDLPILAGHRDQIDKVLVDITQAAFAMSPAVLIDTQMLDDQAGCVFTYGGDDDDED